MDTFNNQTKNVPTQSVTVFHSGDSKLIKNIHSFKLCKNVNRRRPFETLPDEKNQAIFYDSTEERTLMLISNLSLYFFIIAFWLAFEYFYSVRKTSERLKAKAVEDSRTKYLPRFFRWTGIVAAGIVFWWGSGSVLYAKNGLFIAGIFFIFTGILLRWYSIQLLGKYFTSDIAIFPDHKIIEAGLYKIIRHPGYAGSLLSFIGLGLIFGNRISLAILIIFSSINITITIKAEEKVLLNYFGIKYKKYIQRTKRLIPYVL